MDKASCPRCAANRIKETAILSQIATNKRATERLEKELNDLLTGWECHDLTTH